MAGCCRWFCSAIFVAILAYVAHYLLRVRCVPDWRLCTPDFYWEAKLPPEVEHLDVRNTAKLKQVLFSGEPWLLQCYSGLPFAGQHLPAPFRLHPVFEESVGAMKSLVKAGTIDCEAKMPSNKTLVSKFGLVRRTQPLLLYAGGGDRPKQIPAASSSSVYGVTAWVKPKAEAKVRVARSQKALLASCAGRRACLISRLEATSPVLEQLAQKFRTVEVVSIGEEAATTLAWGRGEEVGETLDEDEAQHFGRRNSFLRADPDAPKPTRKNSRPAPRLLRGFTGEEDLPSLTRFLELATTAEPESEVREVAEGFVRAELPTITAKQKPPRQKKVKAKGAASSQDDAERQAKRAKYLREKKDKEEKLRKELEEAAKLKGEAYRKEMERKRREQMAAEEESAANIVEEGDGEEHEEDEGEEEEEEVVDFDEEDNDDGSDVLDIDA